MATRRAIAIMREQAFNAIADATGSIAAVLGIAAPVIPTQGKDADLLYAQQLQAIADYLGGMADHFTRRTIVSQEHEPAFVQTVVENEPVLPEPETPDKPLARRKGR